jgi:hypothetical protein
MFGSRIDVGAQHRPEGIQVLTMLRQDACTIIVTLMFQDLMQVLHPSAAGARHAEPLATKLLGSIWAQQTRAWQ